MPLIIGSTYLTHLAVLTLIFSIFAIGYDVVIGGMGQFSFGHQAFWGIGAYVSAILVRDLGGLLWPSILAAVVGAAIVGLVIGLISLKLRGPYLAIVTLGFAMIIQIIIINWKSVTHGWMQVTNIPPLSVGNIMLKTPISCYYLILAVLVLVIFLVSRMKVSRFGRALAAFRENEDRAISVGIPVFKYLVIAFTISAAISSLAGSLYAHYVGMVNPGTAGLSYLWTVLIIVLIGGPGTIGGMILGSFIYILVPELLHVADIYRYIIFGLVVMISVIFNPEGIWPRLVLLWERLGVFVRGQLLKQAKE